jgi:hypothetical protein
VPPNNILPHLPAIHDWIDDLLVRSRPQAKRVSTLPFLRLKRFYSANTLERAWCVFTEHVPVPPLSQLGLPGFEDFEHTSAEGITFQDLYFVHSDRADDESLHFHELVHTVQWRELGPEKFMAAYALGYLHGGGYEDNPFEQIAYQLQDRFVRGKEQFEVEPLVLIHLEKTMRELNPR